MKIVALGLDAAGRNCFISSMYSYLKNNIVNGFEIDDEDGSNFNEHLLSQYHSIKEGQWPAGMCETYIYDMSLVYCKQPVLTVSIMDLRSSLMERGSRVVENINEFKPDSFWLFLPMDYLKNHEELDTRMRIQFYLRRFLLLINHTINLWNKPSVTIILTKSDLVKEPLMYIKTVEFLKGLIDSLFAKESCYYIGIVPVSIIENGRIELKNVHLPLMFTTFSHLFKTGVYIDSHLKVEMCAKLLFELKDKCLMYKSGVKL